MIQQGQVFKLKTKGPNGQPLWAYRYRLEGRGSERPQVGGRGLARSRPILKVNVRILQASDRVYAASNGGTPPVKAFFSAKEVNVGPVIFVIHNFAQDYQQFSVAGAYTRLIGPGGAAVLKVTFKRPGKYVVGVLSENRIQGTSGLLTVIK